MKRRRAEVWFAALFAVAIMLVSGGVLYVVATGN
jgi:hypothetical protein